MRIGIDISQLTYQGTGIARYTENIIEAISKFDTANEFVLFFSSLRGRLPKNFLPSRSLTIKKFPIPPTVLDLLWNKLHIFPVEKLIGKVDIFFTSDWTEPPSKSKKITTIHDLVTYKFPETSSQNIIETHKQKLKWVIKESSFILCDSESTKKDAMEILGIDRKKLRVIYPPVEIKVSPSENIKQKYNITHPYILTVGKIEPRKNIKRLIQAYEKIHIKEVELMVAGPKGWGELDLPEVKGVRFLGYISDEDLYALYKEAVFFVYPSLYEGFGYPVIEAMKLGCPVATSNTSSLKEITSDNGLLFNPESVDEIAQALTKYANDNELREKMKNRGLKRAEDFTLKNFYSQLSQVFQEAYDNWN